MFQSRNVATPSRKELKISSWVSRHSVDQEASQSKSVKLHYLCIFVYIYEDFSDFLWCFLFAEILQNHATVSELPNLSVSKACQVLSTNVSSFNQTTVCSHRHHWGIGHWCTGVYLRIFDPCRSNPIIFLGLCSPVTTGSV